MGLGTLLADGIGDTIRISLSTFHAEEEVKVAWEILKALKLRERGPVLIACPTCGRLQFDMDTVVAEIEERLRQYDDPIEVAVLGCAVNGIGEASHADFGITGAKNEGLIFAHGKPLRKVPQDQLVDELFAEIDKSIDRGTVEVDEHKAAEGAEWLEKIEEENAGEMTPERIAALEAAAATEDALGEGDGQALPMAGAPKAKRITLDEDASPTAGRRFIPGVVRAMLGRCARTRLLDGLSGRREAEVAVHHGGALLGVEADQVLVACSQRPVTDVADEAGLPGHGLRQYFSMGRTFPCNHPAKRVYHHWVELCPRAVAEFLHGVGLRYRFAVRAIRGHGVEGIADGHHAGAERVSGRRSGRPGSRCRPSARGSSGRAGQRAAGPARPGGCARRSAGAGA